MLYQETRKNKLFVLLFYCSTVLLLASCAQKSSREQAGRYASQSNAYYQRAIAEYKALIKAGKDLDNLHLELGKLYYANGEFEPAVNEFKASGLAQAKKFLAISYYRLGRFTDALEIFNQQEPFDDEYLYYHGLACEKLNLFDKALAVYKKIKTKEFLAQASQRADIIEKHARPAHIKEISPEVNKVLESAPAQELYPQAGALILLCDERVEITPQDTEVSYMHYVIKILNERGKESFSETHIGYDSTYDKVELEYARTIKPDGTVVDVGARHIRDVSRYMNFPLYSNARVYIISFPEISEGASIEYKVKVYRNQLINKKDFVISYPVQSSEPIMKADFTLTLPKAKKLHITKSNEKYNDFKADLSPVVKEESGNLIYAWQFKDIPQIVPESNMPPGIEINPSIFMSTFASWQEIYNWWWELAKDKIEADKAIKDKVGELTKGIDSEEARMRAIYNFCAQKIRYVAVEYGQAGYEPHRAPDIFKNKYGDCKDQAILLVTMLKEAGITAWPVLISTKDYYDLNADFPSMLFNHCIAALNLRDKIIFLDPTAETCSFGDLPAGDQNRKVLLIKEGGYEIQPTPLYPAEHNLIKQDIKIKINPGEGISAKKDVFSYGVYDQGQRYWLLYTQPELVKETLNEKIQDISIGARLDNYDIKNLNGLDTAVVLSYAFNGPEYFTVAGPLRIMPQLTALDTSLVAKDSRKYPLDFSILDTKETSLEIQLPPKLTVKYIPKNINEDSPWLKIMVEYLVKDNRLYFKQNAELKKQVVSEAEYPDFKKFFEGLAKKVKQRVVLEER